MGFCVFEGPYPIRDLPPIMGFLCHFWDLFIGNPPNTWGPCPIVGDMCDNYVGVCVL